MGGENQTPIWCRRGRVGDMGEEDEERKEERWGGEMEEREEERWERKTEEKYA